MFDKIKNTFSPPIFPDNEDKTRAARYGNWIALTFMGLIIVYEIFGKITSEASLTFNILDIVLIVLFFLLFAAREAMKRGYVSQANTILVSLMWVISNFFSYLGFGVRDSAYIGNFIIILAASLLLGWRAASILTGMTILVGAGLAYAEINNLSPTAYYTLSPDVIMQDMGVILTIFAVFIYLLISGWDSALRGVRKGSEQLEVANRELQESQINLEKNQRELLLTNRQLKERTDRINAVAQISNTVAVIQDINSLLLSTVHTVAKRFNYYHVGLYLLDESRQLAILRASNSDGGQKMIAHGHQIKVGEQDIIGYISYSGNPRILLDTGSEAVSFNYPDLPETRSEIALPLKSGNDVIGVLDIQSKDTGAFSQDDVESFTILANQVAIAIQNARSLEQAQRALQEAGFATSQLTGVAWKEYTETLHTKGYRYDGIRPEPLKGIAKPTSVEKESLTVPVQLRGQTIGRLRLKTSDISRKLTEDELAIIASTADRVALAVDAARLLDEAQKRAARESLLSEIGSKLSTSFQLDTILRDTVEELGQTLKGSTVTFQLVNPNSPPQIDNDNNGSAAGRKSE